MSRPNPRLKILIGDQCIQEFNYDDLQMNIGRTELTLKATRGPTGAIHDGLIPLNQSPLTI
jgi:hypothetical protein